MRFINIIVHHKNYETGLTGRPDATYNAVLVTFGISQFRSCESCQIFGRGELLHFPIFQWVYATHSCRGFSELSVTPALKKVVLNAHVIKDLSNGLIDDVIDGFWLVIKRWNRG